MNIYLNLISMNKNMNNQKGKGTQRGQMQNQGNKKTEGQPAEEGAYLNNQREPQRVESWSKQNTDREKGIHPAEPTGEKNLNREKETHRMVSWNKQVTDREEEVKTVRPAVEENLKKEKETLQGRSWTVENKEKGDVMNKSASSPTNPMFTHEPAFKKSTTEANPKLGGKGIELKNPFAMGSALYVIAALLLIGWAIGFFFYDAGAIIHVLLVLALISVLIKVAQGRND